MSLSLSAGGREFRSCSETRIYSFSVNVHTFSLARFWESSISSLNLYDLSSCSNLISLAFFCSIFIFCSSSTKANVAFKAAFSFWSRNVSPVTQLMELAFDPFDTFCFTFFGGVSWSSRGLRDSFNSLLFDDLEVFFSDLMSVSKFKNSRSTCSTILSMSRRYSSGFANDLMSSTMPWNSE